MVGIHGGIYGEEYKRLDARYIARMQNILSILKSSVDMADSI